MATAAPETSRSHLEERTREESSMNKSLTNIEWLNELEPGSLMSQNSTSGQSGKSDESGELVKRRKVHKSTGSTPPELRKPPFSYATLIAFAINSGPYKKMTLSQIYEWIETHFPFFKTAKSAWKNSIRHNLSLRDIFIREKRPPYDQGKGSYWMIRPGEEQKVLQTTFRELRQQQPFGPIQLQPHFQANGMAKLLPVLPSTPLIPPYGSFANQLQPQAYLTVPVSLDRSTMRPKERVILPKGPVQITLQQRTETETQVSETKIIGSAAEGVVNDHSYCSSMMHCKTDTEYLDNEVMFDQPDPYFGDYSDVNTRVSSPIVRSTPTKQTSPNYLSPDGSPGENRADSGDLNGSFGLQSMLISTPWKDDFLSLALQSLPNTPIRTGLTPTKGIDCDDLGSLRFLGLPGLTPLKQEDDGNDSLDVSSLERLLEL
jgi:hypothetical protein